MSALIALAIVIAYGFVGAWIGSRIWLREVEANDRHYEDPFPAALGGLFWPFGLWFVFAATLTQRELNRRQRLEQQLAERETLLAERETLLAAARAELDALDGNRS